MRRLEVYKITLAYHLMGTIRASVRLTVHFADELLNEVISLAHLEDPFETCKTFIEGEVIQELLKRLVEFNAYLVNDIKLFFILIVLIIE